MQLSIIVPAYNEEARLGRMLDAYLPYFIGCYGNQVEFIVVVNGSVDQTGALAGRFAERYRQIRVVIEPEPVGKGGAVLIGLAQARGERIGYVDADGATPPEAFQDLTEHIESAGAIIASRWIPGAEVSPRQPLLRRIASRIFNKLVRLMFGFRISDTQCGAKLMSRQAVCCVLPRIGITRWAFDVDLLFQLHRAGFEIVEIPTVWHDMSGSRVRVGQASLEMILAMIRLRLIYSPLKWIVRVYDATVSRVFQPGI